jgi:hypothetical protein
MLLQASDAAQARLLLQNEKVKEWHRYIREKAISERKEILMFVPCAKAKPYVRPTKSFFYNWLWRFLEKERLRDRIFICTVSEPFALFPETDYDKMPNYELSPLVLKSTPSLLEEYCCTLSKPIAGFLRRNRNRHRRVIAYVRPDSTHAMFLRRATMICSQQKIHFALSNYELQRIRKAHPRLWHLDWMIFSEKHLKRTLRMDTRAHPVVRVRSSAGGTP